MRNHVLSATATFAVTRPYPERNEANLPWYDQAAEWLLTHCWSPVQTRISTLPWLQQRIVQATQHQAQGLAAMSEADLLQRWQQQRSVLRRLGFTLSVVARCFALIDEIAHRRLGIRYYPCQLIAGWNLLQGRLVEMATGEGKTLVATLPAAVVALAGYPVHVITVNDYLAQRDAEKLSVLYQTLGLSVGVVVQGMEKPARRMAYQQAITYCTNKELAFDYLRDSILLNQRSSALHLALDQLQGKTRSEELVMRGLYFAVVDEADSVFIDEARTPLILSAQTANRQQADDCNLALEFARLLTSPAHYQTELQQRRIWLTEDGKQQLENWLEQQALGGVWSSLRASEELITQALAALHLYQRDLHYLVADNKVQIIDESTGRVMADRSWERGLHQLIEAKEQCEISAQRETLARLTYQRLFRRYMRLSGMTGTAQEVRSEIRQSYALSVAQVPLHRTSKRQYWPHCLVANETAKWQQVAQRVQQMVALGRPVLIGTRSVKASENISQILTQNGIQHALLNAKQDATEASVIAQAGQIGQVTVATNMAGRGTDILLAPGVAERGGLHVILTEFHESSRVDRQLFGRCSRQGDPGSCEAIVALDDELFSVYAPRLRLGFAHLCQKQPMPLWATNLLRYCAQAKAEKQGRNVRLHTMQQDKRLLQLLAFSGRGE